MRSKTRLVEDHLLLQPGEGAILIVTDPERWETLLVGIARREAHARLQLLQVEQQVLERAGISIEALDALKSIDGEDVDCHDNLTVMLDQADDTLLAFRNSSHPWVLIGNSLKKTRDAFGQINEHWIEIEQISPYDHMSWPEHVAHLAELRELSQRYFEYMSRWKRGDDTLDILEVQALANDVMDLNRRNP